MEGVGIYIRKLLKRRHGTPKQAAKRAANHGIDFVAIMGAWQQPRRGGVVKVGGNAESLPDYAQAFIDRGIDVGLWYYPWAGHESELLDTLSDQIAAMPRCVQPEAIDLNSEIFRGQRLQPSWVEDRARTLMTGSTKLVKAHSMKYGAGHTAYGRAKFHPNYPWDIFLENATFVSPQLYTATKAQLTAGLDEWLAVALDANTTRLPSIGTYGPKSGPKMHAHLSSFIDTGYLIDGFIAWSWMQTNSQEWDVLARWSDWIKRGACAL
jgi:hypothetical protein